MRYSHIHSMHTVNPCWWIRRWSQLYPNKSVIVFEESDITYLELWSRVEAVAAWMQACGIEKRDRVAVLLENCPEFIELYLACCRLGAIFVPLNYRLTAEELDYLIGDSKPRLFVYSEVYGSTVRSLDMKKYRPVPVLAVVGSPGLADHEDYRAKRQAFYGSQPVLGGSLEISDPEDPQVIMYTSGTTGHPKGAVLSHRKTFFNCLNAEIFFDLCFDDRMLVVLPMFHSGGLFIQSAPTLYRGGTLIIHRKFEPDDVYRDIERYRVTKFLGVPTVYRSLFKVEGFDRKALGSLRVCGIGGERVTHDVILKCWETGFPVRQVMGQTETSILLWASEQELIERPGTVGRPVFHADVRVVDEAGRDVAPGEVGEIVVRGPVVMSEYWRKPVETERAMRGGYLHTGDLARTDEDGYYYLVDRAKDMYISGGENVYPAEVERVLREHPDIVDAAVVGVPDETWGETGHAFVIPAPNALLTADEVIAWCRSRLAGYKCPRHVTFCEDFPRTALGKVRKFMLLETLGKPSKTMSNENMAGDRR